MPSISQLRLELLTDPVRVGYGPFVNAGNHAQLARMLADREGPGAGTIQRRTLPYRTLAALAAPKLLLIEEATYLRWKRLLDLVGPIDVLDLTVSAVVETLGRAIADGLLTEAEVGAATRRTGSRAEVLWGEGVTIPAEQIREALA